MTCLPRLPHLLASWSLFALCASAAAASPDVTISPEGFVTPTTLSPAASTRRAEPLAAEVIYSNFSSSGDLYQRGGWMIAGRQSFAGDNVQFAMPFTTVAPVTLKRVSLGLSHLEGTNAYKVNLHADAGGLPGERLRQFSAADIQRAGSCCATVDTGFGGVALEGGKTYWVLVRVPHPNLSDTMGFWNINNTGATGIVAYHVEGHWNTFFTDLLSLEVLGK